MGMSAPPPGGPADGFDAPARRASLASEGGILPIGTGKARSAGRSPATRGPRATKIADRPSMPTMPRSSSVATSDALSYEQAQAELEALVQAMEAGKMPLDQLLASYKRGAELLQLCRARLQAVEDQVKLLEDGQLRPWTAA